MKNNTVRRLVLIALMVALSYILMFIGFPIIPIAPWLNIDFSFLPIVVLALGLDLKSALLAAFMVNFIDFFLKGSMTGLPIDQMTNLIAITIFLVSTVYFAKKGKLFLGLFVSVLINVVLMTILNYFWITPLYFGILGYDLPDNLLLYCVQVYGVFNAVKWGLVAFVYYIGQPWVKQFRTRIEKIVRA